MTFETIELASEHTGLEINSIKSRANKPGSGSKSKDGMTFIWADPAVRRSRTAGQWPGRWQHSFKYDYTGSFPWKLEWKILYGFFNFGNCKRDFTFVDDIVEGIEVSGVTEEQVQQMIDTNLSPIAEQVSANTLSILNTYNKSEVNELLNGFVKIENKTLIINE